MVSTETIIDRASETPGANGTAPEATNAAARPVRHSASYAADKAKILTRLRRIEGQVRGVERMIEEDQYCTDVLTQLSSIIAALQSTGLVVLEDHIRGCVANVTDEDREQVLDELTGSIKRFVRSVN